MATGATAGDESQDLVRGVAVGIGWNRLESLTCQELPILVCVFFRDIVCICLLLLL